MTMNISLPPDEEKKLAERAAASGRDMVDYVHQLIRKDLSLPSLSELLAPVHQAVRESRISEAELAALVDEAIADSRANRNS